MSQKVTCISLRAVRYGDEGVMLSLWSREVGYLSASVRLGAGREAHRRKALLMPPMAFEAVAHRSSTAEVVRLSDVRVLPGFTSMPMSPMRVMVATFLAEVLSILLRQSEPDPTLSAYIFEGWRTLAEASGRTLANFHVVFLSRLTRFLGIEPDVSTYRRGYCFNMREAVFSPSMPVSSPGLPPEEARLAAMLLHMDFAHALRLPMTIHIRNRAINTLLDYYSLHYSPLPLLKSLEILREICT